MKFRPLALCLCTLAVLAGCATPKQLTESGRWSIGYRVDVQQGNVITQEMLAQLQPGMDKKKVGLIMGAPVIKDTFHKDRWDYTKFTPGLERMFAPTYPTVEWY